MQEVHQAANKMVYLCGRNEMNFLLFANSSSSNQQTTKTFRIEDSCSDHTINYMIYLIYLHHTQNALCFVLFFFAYKQLKTENVPSRVWGVADNMRDGVAILQSQIATANLWSKS